MAWWGDRAFQRNPTSRAFATGPASRRAAKPPSHRADEPPSAQAPGIRAPLVRTDPKDRSRRAPRMRSQDSAVSRLSPPLIAHSLTRFAICSGQSHPGLQTQPQPVRHRLESHRSRALRPPGRYGRVRPVRDSPSDVATCHRVVPTGTHSPEQPDDRRDRHKREPRLGPRRPTSPKDRAKSEPQGPLQARGVPGVAQSQTATAWFGDEL